MERDFSEAVTALEQEAKQGDEASQIRLGKLLLSGDTVEKDEAQSYFWFCKAAEKENEIAKMWKGHCLLYGIGVKKNEDEGSTLLYHALNYNFPGIGESQSMAERSQFDWNEDMMRLFWDLGDAYENGLGVPKRAHLAGYYFSMVAEGGWPEAIEKMTHYKERGLFIKRWKRID